MSAAGITLQSQSGKTIELYQGDSLEILKQMEDNSIDLIVTRIMGLRLLRNGWRFAPHMRISLIVPTPPFLFPILLLLILLCSERINSTFLVCGLYP